MRNLIYFISALLIAVSTARADSTTDLVNLGMSPELAGYLQGNLIYKNSSGNIIPQLSAGKSLQLPAQVGVVRVPAVPTMAATPAVGTNQFYPGLNVIPTAAANTAAFLGPATPTPGHEFVISNASGNSVRIKAAGGATMNGATAGGYVVIPNLATVQCFTQAAGNQICLQPVIPTPAGP